MKFAHLFVSYEDYGDVGAEVLHLGGPLLGDVLQRVRRVCADVNGILGGRDTQVVWCIHVKGMLDLYYKKNPL